MIADGGQPGGPAAHLFPPTAKSSGISLRCRDRFHCLLSCSRLPGTLRRRAGGGRALSANPRVPGLLLGFWIGESVVLAGVAVLLFFIPSAAEGRWPWRILPLQRAFPRRGLCRLVCRAALARPGRAMGAGAAGGADDLHLHGDCAGGVACLPRPVSVGAAGDGRVVLPLCQPARERRLLPLARPWVAPRRPLAAAIRRFGAPCLALRVRLEATGSAFFSLPARWVGSGRGRWTDSRASLQRDLPDGLRRDRDRRARGIAARAGDAGRRVRCARRLRGRGPPRRQRRRGQGDWSSAGPGPGS